MWPPEAIEFLRLEHRLRLRNLRVSCRHPLEPWLQEPICEERVRSQLQAAQPFVTWVRRGSRPVHRCAPFLNRG